MTFPTLGVGIWLPFLLALLPGVQSPLGEEPGALG